MRGARLQRPCMMPDGVGAKGVLEPWQQQKHPYYGNTSSYPSLRLPAGLHLLRRHTPSAQDEEQEWQAGPGAQGAMTMRSASGRRRLLLRLFQVALMPVLQARSLVRVKEMKKDGGYMSKSRAHSHNEAEPYAVATESWSGGPDEVLQTVEDR